MFFLFVVCGLLVLTIIASLTLIIVQRTGGAPISKIYESIVLFHLEMEVPFLNHTN